MRRSFLLPYFYTCVMTCSLSLSDGLVRRLDKLALESERDIWLILLQNTAPVSRTLVGLCRSSFNLLFSYPYLCLQRSVLILCFSTSPQIPLIPSKTSKTLTSSL